MNLFKRISSSKTPYLHLFLGLIFSVGLLILLLFLRLFIYWFQFGEGESSSPEYHQIAIVLYNSIPLLIVIAIQLFLIFKNYKVQNLSYVKSYCILIITTVILYFMKEMLASAWINS